MDIKEDQKTIDSLIELRNKLAHYRFSDKVEMKQEEMEVLTQAIDELNKLIALKRDSTNFKDSTIENYSIMLKNIVEIIYAIFSKI